MWALLGVALAQTPGTLEGLLDRGEVNLLETWPNGSLRQVTTNSLVKAPLETVWGLLLDFNHYAEWMPQVEAATVARETPTEKDSNWVLKQVEDENHTLDFGINSAVGIVEVRGIKRKLGV